METSEKVISTVLSICVVLMLVVIGAAVVVSDKDPVEICSWFDGVGVASDYCNKVLNEKEHGR